MMNRTPSVTDVTDAYWLEQRFSGRQRSRAVQVAAGAVLGGRVAIPIEASPGCFARKVSLCRAAVMLFLATIWLRADQVEMQNGDRYLGTVLSLDTNTLVLRSAVLGTVTLPRGKVALIHFGSGGAPGF